MKMVLSLVSMVQTDVMIHDSVSRTMCSICESILSFDSLDATPQNKSPLGFD